MRNGKLSPAIEPRLAGYQATDDTERIAAHDAAEGGAEGSSWRATRYEWACIECAIMVLFPLSLEAVMINQWKDSEMDDSIRCRFVPISDAVVFTLVKLYTSDDKETICSFKCYAGGLSTVNNMLRAVDSVIRAAGFVERPTRAPRVKQATRLVEKAEDPEGAPSFDFATDLEPMVDAMMGMEGWNLTKQTMSCTQLITSCAIMGRVSDVSKFSPRREHLKFPSRRQKQHWGRDGVPEWISLDVWQAKGKLKKHKKRHLRLHRNRLNWKLCPVYWLMLWLRISTPALTKRGPSRTKRGPSRTKIHKGPLFVKVGVGTKRAAVFDHYGDFEGYEAAFDVKGKLITYSTGQWREVLKKVWRKLHMEDLIPHSIRKSAIKWAARCHAQEYQIRNNSGHSESSASWLRYIEDGMIESREMTQGPNGTMILDPIFSVWTWKPVTFSAGYRESRR
jgi:hypothetical protein